MEELSDLVKSDIEWYIRDNLHANDSEILCVVLHNFELDYDHEQDIILMISIARELEDQLEGGES